MVWFHLVLKIHPWCLVNEMAVSLLHEVWADGYKIMKSLISSISAFYYLLWLRNVISCQSCSVLQTDGQMRALL